MLMPRLLVVGMLLSVTANHPDPASLPGPYDRLVLEDHPIAFWNDASGVDLMPGHHDGVLKNAPGRTKMPNGAEATRFDGADQYMEAASDPILSVPATHILTIEAWIRPDALDFEKTEGSGYVYWLGKGSAGQHEYAARMYGQHPTGHDADRVNRISGYVFNSSGGLGAGSYYQAPAEWPIAAGEWMQYVLIINTSAGARSVKYPTGYTKVTITRKDAAGRLFTGKDQDALVKYNIEPTAGQAPFRVGTRDLGSFFRGAVGKVAIYDYEVGEERLARHARQMFIH
jgi:hypothetical protein